MGFFCVDKCYVCDSPDCGNLREETCRLNVACERTDGKNSNGAPISYKKCGPDNFGSDICRNETEHGTVVKKCFCNGDLCNGDGGKPPPVAGTPSTHHQSTSTWLTAVAICLVLKQWSHILST